jgi:hypothetical protein
MVALSRLARISTVVSFGIAVTAADSASAQPEDNPPTLPIEILHQEDAAGSSGQVLILPNGDLLAVGTFSGFVRFDQTGRIVWRRNSGDVALRHTIALPGGGFVSTGSQKGLPISLFPPGIAIKGNKDLWVGRFDDGGDLLWAKAFGDLQLEMGQSVAALQNGILVVAGFTGNQETWLLELTLEGRLRQESHLGGSRSAVVALTDSEFGIVAQVPEYRGGCRDAYDTTPVKIWRIDTSFGLRDVVTVRNDARGDLTGCGWRFEIARGRDVTHVFVLSAWTSTHRSPPIPQITKVDLEKGALWARTIPEVDPDPNARDCRLSMTILPSGDPVVACTSRSRIELHRFDAAEGRGARYRVDPPNCDPTVELTAWYVRAVGVQALPDGNVVMTGNTTRRIADGWTQASFDSCSWLARVTMPPDEGH